jgi:gliding motility-associated-like protein
MNISILLIPAFRVFLLLCLEGLLSNSITAQTSLHNTKVSEAIPFSADAPPLPYFANERNNDPFGTVKTYIENIGQYGDSLAGHPELGKILYGYEGLGMPVLFTGKGIIYLQRKTNSLTEEQMEEMERNGTLNTVKGKEIYYTDRTITMEWMNTNPHPEIVKEELTRDYHTYGSLNRKAKAFKRIIYRELYPGIDMICSFAENDKAGFEYSLVVKPGADVSAVKMRFGGDIKDLQVDAKGNFVISSGIGDIIQSLPVSYYCNENECTFSSAEKNKAEKIHSLFNVKGKELGFVLPGGYDHSRSIIIDPFVTSAGSLTGTNAGIAKDIDFDYNGNIYVTGGGNSSVNQLAKFDRSGNLLWTFNGSLSVPSWTFGYQYGGWVVEKTTGNIYLGQGSASGFQIIRLNTSGLYDGYISAQDINFLENWRMIWNCDGGNPKIMAAGGGAVDNINLGLCTPPNPSLSSLNLTGQPGGHQDLSDMVIDPKTNEMYTIFSQGFVSNITENNRIYKHKPPYTSGNSLWNRLSGFTVLNERQNRPYLADSPGFNDNSINSLAVNSRYLFYYDGLNLKAFNKSNGNDVGTAITISANTPLMQGGIVADECDNVYVGSTKGIIKVYQFNGSIFNDAAAPDINISGFSAAPIYDLAYDNAKNLLYACGKGFVASVNISSYCAAAIYSVSVKTNCLGSSATAAITPALPAGSVVTYVLYDGSTEISSNSTGIFSGLNQNVLYTMKALVNKACGGTQAIKDFSMSSCGAGLVGSGIYVPTGFTPNDDGLNDILKAIPYGIKEFKYFSLYNRWGEQVFTTTDPGKGWDGKFRGTKQNSGVYVWMAEAIDYNDQRIWLKGTAVLIR